MHAGVLLWTAAPDPRASATSAQRLASEVGQMGSRGAMLSGETGDDEGEGGGVLSGLFAEEDDES